MTGLRCGYVHGPKSITETMLKIQQYTFVCAPQPVQWAGAVALDTDMSPYVDRYRVKRDRMLEGLAGHYEFVKPGGAFYLFPKLPWGNNEEFINAAIANGVMVIPGNIFSDFDTHFRISYAVDDQVIERGIDALCRIAEIKAAV